MSVKYILPIFILSFMTVLIGAIFKLESWPYASELLMTGLGTGILAMVLLVIKFLGDNNSNKPLNS